MKIKFIKPISIVVSIIFIWDSIAWAVPGGLDVSSMIDSHLVQSHESPVNLCIPEQYGRIEQANGQTGQLANRQTVVLIKDAHCNYEAQRNIARILDILIKDYKIDLVCVEGASMRVDPSIIADSPDRKRRERVADKYLKKGWLTASEALAIERGKNYGFSIWGAEDLRLYLKNLKVFRDVYSRNSTVERFVELVENLISNLKAKLYNREVLAFDKNAQGYRDNKLSLTEFIKYLYEIDKEGFRKYPNLRLVLKALFIEKAIDFNMVEKERAGVIKDIENRFPKEDIQELVKNSLLYKLGKISSLTYYEYLKKFILPQEYRKYPNLYRYIKNIMLHSRIDADGLFRELDILVESIYKNYLKDELSMKLHNYDEYTGILGRLLRLEITRDELERYRNLNLRLNEIVEFFRIQCVVNNISLPPEFTDNGFITRVEDFFKSPEEFYNYAIERDSAIVENLIRRMNTEGKDKAVLVVGGFHADSAERLLREKGIQVITITPSITKEDTEARRIYLSRMMDENIQPDKMLMQLGTNNLSPVPLTARDFAVPNKPKIAQIVESLRELRGLPPEQLRKKVVEIVTQKNISPDAIIDYIKSLGEDGLKQIDGESGEGAFFDYLMLLLELSCGSNKVDFRDTLVELPESFKERMRMSPVYASTQVSTLSGRLPHSTRFIREMSRKGGVVYDMGIGWKMGVEKDPGPVTTIELAEELKEKAKVIGIDNQIPACVVRTTGVAALFNQDGVLFSLENFGLFDGKDISDKDREYYTGLAERLRKEANIRDISIYTGYTDREGNTIITNPIEQYRTGNLDFLSGNLFNLEGTLPSDNRPPKAHIVRISNLFVRHYPMADVPHALRSLIPFVEENGYVLIGYGDLGHEEHLVYRKRGDGFVLENYMFSVGLEPLGFGVPRRATGIESPAEKCFNEFFEIIKGRPAKINTEDKLASRLAKGLRKRYKIEAEAIGSMVSVRIPGEGEEIPEEGLLRDIIETFREAPRVYPSGTLQTGKRGRGEHIGALNVFLVFGAFASAIFSILFLKDALALSQSGWAGLNFSFLQDPAIILLICFIGICLIAIKMHYDLYSETDDGEGEIIEIREPDRVGELLKEGDIYQISAYYGERGERKVLTTLALERVREPVQNGNEYEVLICGRDIESGKEGHIAIKYRQYSMAPVVYHGPLTTDGRPIVIKRLGSVEDLANKEKESPEIVGEETEPQIGKWGKIVVDMKAGRLMASVDGKDLGVGEGQGIDKQKLIEQLKGIVQDDYKGLIEQLINLLPDEVSLYIFSNLIGDAFGKAVPEHNAILLHESIADNPIALFHEIAEYLIATHILTLILKGNVLIVNGQMVKLDSEPLAIANKSAGGPHYLFRALQRQVFGGRDRDLTLTIKAEQLVRDIKELSGLDEGTKNELIEKISGILEKIEKGEIIKEEELIVDIKAFLSSDMDINMVFEIAGKIARFVNSIVPSGYNGNRGLIVAAIEMEIMNAIRKARQEKGKDLFSEEQELLGLIRKVAKERGIAPDLITNVYDMFRMGLHIIAMNPKQKIAEIDPAYIDLIDKIAEISGISRERILKAFVDGYAEGYKKIGGELSGKEQQFIYNVLTHPARRKAVGLGESRIGEIVERIGYYLDQKATTKFDLDLDAPEWLKDTLDFKRKAGVVQGKQWENNVGYYLSTYDVVKEDTDKLWEAVPEEEKGFDTPLAVAVHVNRCIDVKSIKQEGEGVRFIQNGVGLRAILDKAGKNGYVVLYGCGEEKQLIKRIVESTMPEIANRVILIGEDVTKDNIITIRDKAAREINGDGVNIVFSVSEEVGGNIDREKILDNNLKVMVCSPESCLHGELLFGFLYARVKVIFAEEELSDEMDFLINLLSLFGYSEEEINGLKKEFTERRLFVVILIRITETLEEFRIRRIHIEISA